MLGKERLVAAHLLQTIGQVTGYFLLLERRQLGKDLDAVFEHLVLRLIQMRNQLILAHEQEVNHLARFTFDIEDKANLL